LNIEDLISISENNNMNGSNDTRSEIESGEENNDNDIEDIIETQNENENRIQNREICNRGRPKGLTSAESLKRKEEYLKERENRLREEGVETFH